MTSSKHTKPTVLTAPIAISLGVIGLVAALVSGFLFTIQIVNPGCGSVDSGFPVPWVLTPQGCPPNWSTATVYAWPFLVLDALFYMGIGYAVIMIHQKHKRPQPNSEDSESSGYELGKGSVRQSQE